MKMKMTVIIKVKSENIKVKSENIKTYSLIMLMVNLF